MLNLYEYTKEESNYGTDILNGIERLSFSDKTEIIL